MYLNNNNQNYNIGLYIRLSREDGDDMESESVSNQRSLLLGYLKANHLNYIDEYVDDGYSGGNFNRPSFQRLIRDIENKKINCVITKDLSRLGRDYIDTGRYIERYFPEHNIRYIAINDDIDTFLETSGSDMMPFRLGINDIYAKDISKKVRSNLLAMKKEGKFCGSLPAYGYMRSKEDKHILVPNPKTSKVVKYIFDLYISGVSTNKIAEILTKKEYPTPIMLKGCGKNQNIDHPEIWKHTSVVNILKNRVYTGCLIQHKTQNINYKTKKRKIIPEQEWCIKENAHEPIIDLKTFELAQTIRNKANNYNPDRRNVDYLLAGMVYCKDCGSTMSISYDKKRDRISMNCNRYRKFSKYGFCNSHYMNYRKLEKTVLTKIKQLSNSYLHEQNDFKKIIQKNNINPKDELINKIEKINRKISFLEKKQDALYDDKFQNIISSETYKRLFNNTELELKKLKTKLDKYNIELTKIKDNYIDSINYLEIIDNYLNMVNPTKEMLNKIIDKIYITKDKEVEIKYRIKA